MNNKRKNYEIYAKNYWLRFIFYKYCSLLIINLKQCIVLVSGNHVSKELGSVNPSSYFLQKIKPYGEQ